MSVLSIHGTNDPLIPINGLRGVPSKLNDLGIPAFLSYDAAAKFWTDQDGITGSPYVTKNGSVTERDYTGGKDNSEVVQYTVAGGTHNWYGSDPNNGSVPANESINATQTIWSFFAAHPKVEPA